VTQYDAVVLRVTQCDVAVLPLKQCDAVVLRVTQCDVVVLPLKQTVTEVEGEKLNLLLEVCSIENLRRMEQSNLMKTKIVKLRKF
jgi:hypothetical protein